jgi:putative acetyltransferase
VTGAIRHSSGFAIAEALEGADIAACKGLFDEYRSSLGVSLDFQDFERELATLPGAYARPRGRLLIARVVGQPAGCAALRPLDADVAEMKRLFVRPDYRGMGLGRTLAECAIDEARALGYRSLVLDTLPEMHAAHGLYIDLGFREVARYNDNPVEGARFLSLELAAG